MSQTRSNAPLSPQRYPLMALALLALLAGLWGGLLRIGWAWPAHPPLVMGHGPLMVCGFLGTLIGVERAVALDRRWAWIAPALAALGTLALLAGGIGWLGPILFSLSSAALTLLFFVPRRPLHAYSLTMALGAATWLVGNLLWLAGLPLYQVTLWWAMFLVFTIAGERLELSRVLRLPRSATGLFAAVVAVLLVGLALSVVEYGPGVRLLGVGMLLLAAWLARYDVARRTVRMTGLTRYIAVALLSGYVWLAVGGVLAVAVGGVPRRSAVRRDAACGVRRLRTGDDLRPRAYHLPGRAARAPGLHALVLRAPGAAERLTVAAHRRRPERRIRGAAGRRLAE